MDSCRQSENTGTMLNAALRELQRPTVLVAAAVILGLSWVDPRQAAASLAFLIRSLAGISPFILLAASFAGYAKASGADRLIAAALAGKPGKSIVGASLAGALSPFCSCGVIPLMASMLASGVPLAPVLAFCVASPIMDPEMFVLTAAGITVPFAVAKTGAAIAMGLLSGGVAHLLERRGLLAGPLRRAGAAWQPQALLPLATPAAAVEWKIWRQSERQRLFVSELAGNAWFIGRWLALAFFLESLMVAYVPAEQVASLLGGGQVLAIPLAAVVGAPAYINGYAAIPLVARLLDLGMAPGAAMAFMVAGAVSSIPAAVAVYALVRRAVFALYAVLGIVGSVVVGMACQLLWLWI